MAAVHLKVLAASAVMAALVAPVSVALTAQQLLAIVAVMAALVCAWL